MNKNIILVGTILVVTACLFPPHKYGGFSFLFTSENTIDVVKLLTEVGMLSIATISLSYVFNENIMMSKKLKHLMIIIYKDLETNGKNMLNALPGVIFQGICVALSIGMIYLIILLVVH